MTTSSSRRLFLRVLAPLLGMISVAAVIGLLVAGLAIPFVGLTELGARQATALVQQLPDDLETDVLPQRTTIQDRHGNPIATIYDQNRVNVRLDQVSPRMVKAILAIEDHRFYQHGALDLQGTLRAFATNQARGGVSQGGSSITQQLVKLTLIQQAEGDREKIAEAQADTYTRKLRELRYAIALEQRHSKDWILERYLNTAYFGDGAYGVQAAAKHFFDVDAKDLDWRQAATLAGLVRSPHSFDPTRYPNKALERRNVVVDRLAELGVLPPRRAERIKARGLGLDVEEQPRGCMESTAPWFCDYVVQHLLDDPDLGRTREDREALLRSGGLTIRTTMAPAFQEAAETAVANHVFPTDLAVGGVAMVEPGTGNVRAVAQSRPMGADQAAGETFLNYTIPEELGEAAPFQVGSTAKVFVLAAALEQGIPLDRWYDSPPTMTFDQSEFRNCEGKGAFGGPYPVKNSTSSGRMNLYSGTRLSVNTFYLQLERETGVCQPFNLAKALGVRLTNPTGDERGNGAERVPSFALGIFGASPVEMAEAYATFPARGRHCDARPVARVEDSSGTVLKRYPVRCARVLTTATADAVNDVLRGVVAPGGFASAQTLDQPAAGKTGTTQDDHSVWFAGYTANMATAAFIAAVDETGRPATIPGRVIGGIYRSGGSGAGFAAPMWGDAMKAIDHLLPDEDFRHPATVPGVGETSAPAPAPSPRPSLDPPPEPHDHERPNRAAEAATQR